MARWTDEDRVRALATLEANGGNVSDASRATGVPRPTIIMWRENARAAGLTVADRQKTDWAEACGEAVMLGVRIIEQNLRRYDGLELTPSALKDVATVTGIIADKHLDYRDGRKGAATQVNVDARQQMVVVSSGRLIGGGSVPTPTD